MVVEAESGEGVSQARVTEESWESEVLGGGSLLAGGPGDHFLIPELGM